MFKILIFGTTGAGKDTQAGALSASLGVPSYSVGGLIRAEINSGTELGKSIATYVERGEIPPGNIGSRLLTDKITSGQPYIINGYPRSLESLERYLALDTPTHIVHLVISDDVAHERVMSRGRVDDTEAAIAERLRRYETGDRLVCQRLQVLFPERYFDVDGSLPPDEVAEEILTFIHARTS